MLGVDVGLTAARAHLLERFAGVDRVILVRPEDATELFATEEAGVLVATDAALATLGHVEPSARGWTVLVTPEVAAGPLALFPPQVIRRFADLVARRRVAAQRVSGAAAPATPPCPIAPAVSMLAFEEPRRPEVVAIASSTGGPEALAKLLAALPAEYDTPLLITQHMGGTWMSALVALLTRLSHRTVALAEERGRVERGMTLVAPGDRHLILERTPEGLISRLAETPPENWCRPAADPMFRSVANVCGSAAAGVVLTGMGSDGALGAEQLAARGATVFVQDEESSAVWGMPRAVLARRVPAIVLPPTSIAASLENLRVHAR
jgi:two-component system chemotaxis response regulator CheB